MKAVKREHNHVDEQQNGISQPPTKKRRLSEDKSTGPTTSIECEIKDISFSTPLRKKLNLELVRGGFRAVNGTTGKAEFGMSWDQVGKQQIYPKENALHHILILSRSCCLRISARKGNINVQFHRCTNYLGAARRTIMPRFICLDYTWGHLSENCQFKVRRRSSPS